MFVATAKCIFNKKSHVLAAGEGNGDTSVLSRGDSEHPCEAKAPGPATEEAQVKVLPTCSANPRWRMNEWDVRSASPSHGDHGIRETIARVLSVLVPCSGKSLKNRP